MSTTPETFGAGLPDAVGTIAELAMRRIVLTVEGAVKRRTPVRTGTLRRSITSAVRDAGMVGIVGTAIIYARPVNRRAQYFQKGLEDSRPQVEAILREAGLGGLKGAVE
jgi:hypothetical protein